MPQQRLTKFTPQPGAFAGRQITDRDFEIIKTIARYRFLPGPYALKLSDGNERVTQRRLQILFHNGLINRFAWGRYKQAVYYLDSRDTLRLLQSHLNASLPAQLWEEADNNREKDYAGAIRRQEQGRLLFIDHELMIGRMHFLLEMCSRDTGNRIELASWRQGAELWHRVEVPKLDYDTRQGKWVDSLTTHWLPHRPDAFFSLKFLDRPEGQNLAHFLYEADRGTMPTPDMKMKLRAHFHFVVKQKRHQHYYGVHPIRAVLVETTQETWGKTLLDAAADPMVCGAKPSPLFWFTVSTLLTEEREITEGSTKRRVPRYLIEPDLILKPIWALASDRSLHSLQDVENH